MNALVHTLDYPAFDAAAYEEAMRIATIRAQHSFFDQHVIGYEDGSYRAVDEGGYNCLPQDLIDRIVHTVSGMMADDFDEPEYRRAGQIGAGLDCDFDASDFQF
jgi:hypothetical protein